MALQTYSDLQAAIADFLNRQDLVASIPNFIVLAESDFNRKLRTNDMEARVITSLAYQFTQLPDDFRGMRLAPKVAAFGTWWNLESISADELAEFRYRNANAAGCPKRYAIVGDSIEVEPTPDTAYTMRLAYWRQIPALSTDNTTNWLLTKHPDLYLYTALLHSAPYLKDDDRLQIWSGMRSQILDDITIEDQRSTYGGTPRVTGRGIG